MAFRAGDEVTFYDPESLRVVRGTIRGFAGDGATIKTLEGEWVYVPILSLRLARAPAARP
jgi:hypothetical protein